MPQVVNQRSPLNFVDAGVQVVGATVAIIGHVLSLSNPPAQAATPSSSPMTTSGVSFQFVFSPHLVGVAGSF
jgi:hypothetical protein